MYNFFSDLADMSWKSFVERKKLDVTKKTTSFCMIRHLLEERILLQDLGRGISLRYVI